MSEGNNMTEAAAGTATGDETQVQANTAATAPAPHLPVPVAALNPRQFVPPLSPRVRQSLSRKKERRRNETRLHSPRNCRHFRPESRRGGAEGVEEVGGRRSGRRQGAGGECRLARHWREARRRVCSDEPNILKPERKERTACGGRRAWADGACSRVTPASSLGDPDCGVTQRLNRKREDWVSSWLEPLWPRGRGSFNPRASAAAQRRVARCRAPTLESPCWTWNCGRLVCERAVLSVIILAGGKLPGALAAVFTSNQSLRRKKEKQ